MAPRLQAGRESLLAIALREGVGQVKYDACLMHLSRELAHVFDSNCCAGTHICRQLIEFVCEHAQLIADEVCQRGRCFRGDFHAKARCPFADPGFQGCPLRQRTPDHLTVLFCGFEQRVAGKEFFINQYKQHRTFWQVGNVRGKALFKARARFWAAFTPLLAFFGFAAFFGCFCFNLR